AQIIVVSDGDMIVNDIDYKRNAPMPLGYDRLTGKIFANKDFALYAIDYLLDAEGLIIARNKQITLRPLDKQRLKDEKTKWQMINLLGPLLTLGIVGAVWQWWRKRSFGR
ncbi:MAG: gliding motility-associated ABC transporter substrate-binding protein GldG, partial [Runella sp.]